MTSLNHKTVRISQIHFHYRTGFIFKYSYLFLSYILMQAVAYRSCCLIFGITENCMIGH